MNSIKVAYHWAGVEVCSYQPNGRSIPQTNQELAMADLAFVVTSVAIFALVALIARGVTKL